LRDDPAALPQLPVREGQGMEEGLRNGPEPLSLFIHPCAPACVLAVSMGIKSWLRFFGQPVMATDKMPCGYSKQIEI